MKIGNGELALVLGTEPGHLQLAEKLEKRMRELMKEAGAPADPDAVAAYIASSRPVQ